MVILPRLLESDIARALGVHGIVLLEGPRACGKTTLLRTLRERGVLSTLVDLADPATRSAAASDPLGFIEALGPGVGIDEAQLVPELLLAIKQVVDRPAGWGPAVLTGSAPVGRNELGGTPPLAGRSARRTMSTLSEREMSGGTSSMVDLLWTVAGRRKLVSARLDKPQTLAVARRSGFPAARNLDDDGRDTWIDENYVAGVLPSSLRAQDSRVMPQLLGRVLEALCSAPAAELNVSKLSRDLDITRDTAMHHVQLLFDLHLVHAVPGWKTNSARRSVSRPKIHAVDGGLAHWAVGRSPTDQQTGGLIESLVVRELRVQLEADRSGAELFHWRSRSGEVDVVVVRGDEALLIEVKATRSVGRDAARGFEAFEREHSKLACTGVMMYLGDEIVPLADNRAAVPVSVLWATPDPDPTGAG